MKTRTASAAALLALGLLAPAAAQTPAAPAGAPAADGILATLSIPDLEATLRRLDDVVTAFNPAAPPGMSKLVLGGVLGDPQLMQMRLGEPVVLMLFGSASGTPSYAWLVPVNDGSGYASALRTRGWSIRETPGMLLAASDEGALDRAAAERKAYAGIRNARVEAEARLTLNVPALRRAFGPMIEAGFESAMAASAVTPSAEASKAFQPFARLWGRSAAEVFAQIEQMRMDLSLEAAARLGFDWEVSPSQGSALAELARMAPASASPLRGLLPASGFMSAVYQMEGARVAQFVGRMLDRLAADPESAKLLTPELRRLLEDGGWFDGRAVVRMRAGSGGRVVGDGAWGAADEAKALAFLEAMASVMAPTGAIAKSHESMGVAYTTTFERDVRRHRGVAIHRLKANLDARKAPPEQAAQLRAMVGDVDFAITRGVQLMSQEPAVLQAMIDRLIDDQPAAAADLQAAALLGPGAHFYTDYDLVGLMRAGLTAAGGATAFSIPENVASEPMLAAATLSNGSLRFRTQIPLKPFAAIAQAAAGSKKEPSPRPESPPKKPSPLK
jgi:hypothetical protein